MSQNSHFIVSFVPEGRGFRTKTHPRPKLAGGGGEDTRGLHLILP